MTYRDAYGLLGKKGEGEGKKAAVGDGDLVVKIYI